LKQHIAACPKLISSLFFYPNKELISRYIEALKYALEYSDAQQKEVITETLLIKLTDEIYRATNDSRYPQLFHDLRLCFSYCDDMSIFRGSGLIDNFKKIIERQLAMPSDKFLIEREFFFDILISIGDNDLAYWIEGNMMPKLKSLFNIPGQGNAYKAIFDQMSKASNKIIFRYDAAINSS
jgi:hypothetical protein